jgi:TPR repeat protein
MKFSFSSYALIIGLSLATKSFAVDSKAYIDRAASLIEAGEFSLARSYLAPALVDPYIAQDLRGKAFYLRGYSYFAQDLQVSSLKDFARALEFSPNNAAVLFMVGRAHFEGLGTKTNANLGVDFFRRAAELGHIGASSYLGFALLQGKGVTKDLTQGRAQFSVAINQDNDAYAMMQMALSYRAEMSESPDVQLAQQWYQKAFAAGEPSAYVALAYMYSNGEFKIPQDQANRRAVDLLDLALDAGSQKAYIRLAYSYLTGVGADKDYGKAYSLYQSAVDAGQAEGFAGIGYMFEAGLGRPVDLEQAEKWYLRGVEVGDAYAHSAMAYMFLGQEKDELALQWFARNAILFDSAKSHNDLAWLLATSKVAAIRDGDRSLEHAQKAVGILANAAYLDTLAAAQAEIGSFEEAIKTQEKAITAASDEATRVKSELQKHLLSYQNQQAWRE